MFRTGTRAGTLKKDLFVLDRLMIAKKNGSVLMIVFWNDTKKKDFENLCGNIIVEKLNNKNIAKGD